jgi:cytochrome c biogenesis protein CcmG/thiol:disulfide interchange protein DsbE
VESDTANSQSPNAANSAGQSSHSVDRLLVGAIVVLAAALVWIVSGTLQERIVHAGDTAPDFKIVSDSGRTYTRKDFGGKILVLNFWASWCEPCVQEVPSLTQFQRELGPDGVVVLGVSIDTNEKRYKQFLQRFRVNFPTARDPLADISSDYGTFQIPETYVIDTSGKVREKIISNQDWMAPEFVARVKAML